MAATDIALHALNIARGAGATMLCGVMLLVSGLALTPSGWRAGGRGMAAAMLGAAVVALLCWFGVAHQVPITLIIPAFLGSIVLVAVVRGRWMADALRAQAAPSTLRWLLLFLSYFILVYVFTLPPVTDEYLAPSWTGNVDLLTYSRFTHYVMRPGTLRAANADPNYIGFVYLQTAAVFYFLGGLSFLFRQDPLTATMPLAFALSALVGCLAAAMARGVFRMSRETAVAIGAILLTTPFFRYIAGAYFLSTLMSTPVMLYVVWLAVSTRPERLVEPDLAVRYFSAYVLLLLLYPFLFFVTLAAHAGVIGLLLLAEVRCEAAHGSARWAAASHAVRRVTNVTLPLVILGTILFDRLEWSVHEVRSLSAPGAAGWELGLISPWAVLGVPAVWLGLDKCGFCIAMESVDHATVLRGLAVYSAFGMTLLLLYFWRFRTRTTPEQQTMVGVACGAFLGYCAFYVMSGPTYQQWKFASYTVLPWSFVVPASLVHLVRIGAANSRWQGVQIPRPVRTSLASALLVVCAGGNMLAHTLADPPLMRLPAGLRNLTAVDAMSSFQHLTVKMDESSDAFATLLAIYFMPDKTVHIISPRLARDDKLSYDEVTPQRPLLLQNVGCAGIGHDDVIPVAEIGCLLFAPPSVDFDTPYSFNQTYLFVDPAGLGPREAEGRWNVGGSVSLTLTGDLKRVPLYDDGFVNLRLNPYLPPGTTRQRVRLAWGSGSRAEVVLTAREVISLPIARHDWAGVRMWTLPITVELPDGVVPSYMYAPKQRSIDGPLAVLFEEVSLTRGPAGRVAASAGHDDAAR